MRTRTLAILGLGLVLALTAGLIYALVGRQDAPTAQGHPSSTPTGVSTPETPPSPSPTPTPAAPSPTPTPQPRGPEATVREFIAAWLERDPTTRVAALQATAIPHLAELLADTDPARIPDAAPAGDPRQITLPAGAGPEHVPDAQRWAQDLDDGTTVWVDIIPDPDSGWLAAAIQPTTE